MKFFENRRLKKLEAEKRLAEEEKGLDEYLAQELKIATDKMTSSPCAVNSMNNCDKSCVHFKEGRPITMLNFRGYLERAVSSPRCRLWR